ncbi:MAG: restriction endonuclease subunit S [Acidobacteria bacterium]|nr:restriction endonuclease subunit S [Acidobacteriota bacterium]
MGWPAYPAYKASSVGWLGDLPEHWEVGNLRRFALMRTGHTPSRSEAGYWEDCDVPWFTLADVWQLRDGSQAFLSDTKEKISRLGLANSAAELLPAGTVCFSRTASVGFSGIMPVPMATTQDFWNWVPGRKLTSQYLLHLFRAMHQEFARITMGSTHKTIYQPDAARLAVCVPPIPEQHVITEFLVAETARIDTLVAKKRELIERLNEKRAALISRTVTRGLPPDAARAAGLDPRPKLKPSGIDWLGEVPAHWAVKRLRHVLHWIEQGWSPECGTAVASPDEWGVLKAGCCNGGYFLEDENKALPPDLEAPAGLEVKAGDLLMSRASGSEELIGSVAQVPPATRPRLLLSDKLFRLWCNSREVEPAMLAMVLQSPIGRLQIQLAISGASGLAKNIAQADVRELLLPIAPLPEQAWIAAYLQEKLARIDEVARRITLVAERLVEYRSALITAAVTGRIDVRGTVAPAPPGGSTLPS